MEEDIRGAPLYIASVLNDSDAVRALLDMGANVNYRHPSPHADTPILHCAQQGYVDCLWMLLNSPGVQLETQVGGVYHADSGVRVGVCCEDDSVCVSCLVMVSLGARYDTHANDPCSNNL